MKHWLLLLTILATGFANTSLTFAGDLWETTTTIDGMPEMAGLGAQKHTICLDSKTGVNERAVPVDERCTRNEYKVVGSKVVFSATCPEGRVDGEMTSTSNSYSGNMRMQSKEGDMKMKFTGKRLSTNSCEPPKAPVVVAPKVDCDQLMGDTPFYGAKSTDEITQSVKSNEPVCHGFKAKACSKLGNVLGSMGSKDASSGKPPQLRELWETGAKYCGLNPDKVAREACGRAANGPSASYLHDNCKTEFDAAVKANCTGRDFTTKNSRYSGLCSIAASHADYTNDRGANSGPSSSSPSSNSSSSSSSSASDAAKQTTDQTVEGVKKGLESLKGLFGK